MRVGNQGSLGMPTKFPDLSRTREARVQRTNLRNREEKATGAHLRDAEGRLQYVRTLPELSSSARACAHTV